MLLQVGHDELMTERAIASVGERRVCGQPEIVVGIQRDGAQFRGEGAGERGGAGAGRADDMDLEGAHGGPANRTRGDGGYDWEEVAAALSASRASLRSTAARRRLRSLANSTWAGSLRLLTEPQESAPSV